MIMREQVLSIEQMQHLKELGVNTSKASMCYRRRIRDFRGESKVGRWSLVVNQPIIVSNFETYEEVPTFTLQDIINLLPKKITTNDFHRDSVRFVSDFSENKIGYAYSHETCGEISFYKEFCWVDKIINAAYEMLCWYIKTI